MKKLALIVLIVLNSCASIQTKEIKAQNDVICNLKCLVKKQNKEIIELRRINKKLIKKNRKLQ